MKAGLRRVQHGCGRWLGSACHVCAQWQTEPVCASCLSAFAAREAQRCRCCAQRLTGFDAVCAACARHPPAFDQACAALDYDYPWDGLIGRFKFEGQCELAGPLAAVLTDAVQQHLANLPDETRPDWILPVPLRRQRLQQRGYNQAWELARRVAIAVEIPAQSGWVERVLETPQQVGLARAQRLHNLRGAFSVTVPGRAALAGRRVALVDDVMTTGATLEELTQTLRRAGVATVQVWVLARTRPPDAAMPEVTP